MNKTRLHPAIVATLVVIALGIGVVIGRGQKPKPLGINPANEDRDVGNAFIYCPVDKKSYLLRQSTPGDDKWIVDVGGKLYTLESR